MVLKLTPVAYGECSDVPPPQKGAASPKMGVCVSPKKGGQLLTPAKL